MSDLEGPRVEIFYFLVVYDTIIYPNNHQKAQLGIITLVIIN